MMMSTYQHSYQQAEQPMKFQSKMSYRETDTEEVASFLLALKHRSVTPEPLDDGCTLQTTEAHAQPYVDKTPASMEEQEDGDSVFDGSSLDHLISDSELVLAKDRDLVPDALFVAMAQMTPCKLTQADRVGCYKTREIGFLGMCCKHCGGQPGFGRFYPNSVRSMAQTTTSQTITKHIGSKCRFAPPHIRKAVVDLQRQQAEREGMSSGRPRYGSRKIFFQRVWARLHGGPVPDDDDDGSKKTAVSDEASSRTPDLEDSRNSSPATSDDEDSASQKHGFYFAAEGKNMKRKLSGGLGITAKRPRFLPTN